MSKEKESDSISTRTRSQQLSQQPPIVTVQQATGILQKKNSSSSSSSSSFGDSEGSDIEPTNQQYNPRTLQFLTTTTTNADAMASSSPFDADLLYIFTDVLKIEMTQEPLHSIPAGVLH